MKQVSAILGVSSNFLTMVLLLSFVSVAKAEMKALTIQELPNSPICFKHLIDGETQIVGFRTNGVCEKAYGLGEALPAGASLDLYISTSAKRNETVHDQSSNKVTGKLSVVEVSKLLKSNVREVVEVKVDERGSIVVETVTFMGCGSDCFYKTEITYLKIFEGWISPYINGIYADEAVRYIQTSKTNYY